MLLPSKKLVNDKYVSSFTTATNPVPDHDSSYLHGKNLNLFSNALASKALEFLTCSIPCIKERSRVDTLK